MGLAPAESDLTTAPKPKTKTAPIVKPESNTPAASTKLYTVRSGVILTDKDRAKLAEIGAEVSSFDWRRLYRYERHAHGAQPGAGYVY